MDPNSSEYIVSRNYLETITMLPWNTEKNDYFTIEKAKKILDSEHYGLEDVKKRIVEYLSVRKLKGDNKGSIILLVGPPGVGKTSIGKSIANAMNKPFFRFSVGGLRDEAEKVHYFVFDETTGEFEKPYQAPKGGAAYAYASGAKAKTNKTDPIIGRDKEIENISNLIKNDQEVDEKLEKYAKEKRITIEISNKNNEPIETYKAPKTNKKVLEPICLLKILLLISSLLTLLLNIKQKKQPAF